MPAPPEVANDAARIASLRTFAILDTPPETGFDDIVEVAAHVCDTPTAVVTFIDERRQWFKARYGYGPPEIDRALSFCGFTIALRALLEVRDARLDPRFADNPMVTGDPYIQFYAGVPLIVDGYAIGSLAVTDQRPRTLSEGQRRAMHALARQVVAQLELRRYALEAERRSERRALRLHALLASALDAIILMDDQGRIVELNPAAADTFGISRAAALGEDMADVMIPERLRDAHRRGMTAYLRTGQERVLGRRIETTALRADREFPIELTITRLGTEEPPVFAGFVRDLTEQRESEAQLRQSIERFELAARATHDVIYDWDISTNNLWWSEMFPLNYGYKADEIEPGIEAWLARIHPEDAPAMEASINATIAQRGAYWTGEYRFRRGDGAFAQVFDRGYFVYGADGRALRMIGAISDMTTRRRLEEQLVRSQKMEAIGQLSSGLAHDFNNLLTIIQCNACLLGENASDELGDYVKDILHATERASTLTRQLLMLGRKQRLRETTVDLNRFVEDMMQILHRTLTAKITLKAALDPSAPPIRADASMLEQVLLNVVLNARDAIEGNGTITISTSKTMLDTSAVRHGIVAAPGPYACLSVRDTGAGISPEALPQIFEPFFTTKEIGRGTGLGLSTVYHIVKQHRGWLDVSSTVGAGTTFVMALPASEQTRDAEPPAFASDAMPTGTETILLVEDEDVLRERLAAMLRRHGYKVIECESGPAALEAWRAQAARIDLVLSDLVMPGGLDGREVVQVLRRDRPELCVIYASGFTPEHVGHGEELVDGVNFLEKPYAPSKLLQLIRQQLARSSR